MAYRTLLLRVLSIPGSHGCRNQIYSGRSLAITRCDWPAMPRTGGGDLLSEIDEKEG